MPAQLLTINIEKTENEKFGFLCDRKSNKIEKDPKGPALVAGLKKGDIVVEINGQPLKKSSKDSLPLTEAEFRAFLTLNGNVVKLVVSRGGEESNTQNSEPVASPRSPKTSKQNKQNKQNKEGLSRHTCFCAGLVVWL